MTLPRPARVAALLLLATVTACGPAGNATACGIAAMAGPALLLEQFGVPGQTLGTPPASLPGILPVRLAAGPALKGAVARSDSGWLVGLQGPMPDRPVPGFGVLVLDRTIGPLGVLLYEGSVLRGAPSLGAVATPANTLPLIGLEVDFRGYDQAACPIFPDSLRQ